MSKIETISKLISAGCLCLLFCFISGKVLAGATGLTQLEKDGYLQWLHSLEQVVQAREAAGTTEGNLLYPFDLPGWAQEEIPAYRHLAISKAVQELEEQWPELETRGNPTALNALSQARNYVHLSEFDSALVWFRMATRLDPAGNFRREIGREALAAASAAGDTLAMAQLLTNTLGATELIGREAELVLAFRWLIVQHDEESLNLLLLKLEGHDEHYSDRLRFWNAYALAWIGRSTDALDQALYLIRAGGLSRDLTERQRTWVLAAVPDLLFLNGARSQASQLYTALARSSLGELARWGTYQTAGMDFLEHNYLKAAHGFREVCEGERMGSWQDQACEMAKIADELNRVRTEGEAYGNAGFFAP